MPQARDNGAVRAETPPNPSRRAMLGGTAAALLAGAAIAAIATAARGAPTGAGDDAELIGLCEQHHALERQVRALYDNDYLTADDDRIDAAVDQHRAAQQAIEGRIVETRALTADGIRAKARALTAWAPDLLDEPNPFWDERMVASILRDLTGRAGA